MQLTDLFRCLPLSCTMAAKRCVERQDLRDSYKRPAHPFCFSCKQGATIREQLGHAPQPRKMKARSKRLRPGPKPKPRMPCPTCNDPVPPKQRFCSNACAGLARRKYHETYLTGRTCCQCGGPIKLYINTNGYVDITISMQRRFCSRSCTTRYTNAKRAEAKALQGAESCHLGGVASSG